MPAAPADDLLDRLARGDADAAETLFEVYTPYLRAVVRRQLADRLRSKFDSADVVQSVWVQVVQHLSRDGWKVDTEDQLRGLLATIARRRLVTRVRKHVGKDDQPAEPVDDLPQGRFDRPSEAAQAGDVWTALLDRCPPEHRELLRLKRDGLSNEEIAARTGLHDGSVRRVLRRLAAGLAADA